MKQNKPKYTIKRKDDLEWNGFIKNTKNKSPRQLTEKAVSWVENKNLALDIGAGALNDTKYLLKNGFNVDAVDIENVVLDFSKEIKNNKLKINILPIQEFNLGFEKYDIIVANFVLPFVKSQEIKPLMQRVFNSLKINGIFCGVFFGQNDFYKNNKNIIFNSKEQINELLRGNEKLYFAEIEKERLNCNKELEHYHTFEFISRKLKPNFRKGVASIVINTKNEFLLVNLESFKEEFFTVPGGGQDNNEPLIETAYRELKEELNIDKDELELIGSCDNPSTFYFNEVGS